MDSERFYPVGTRVVLSIDSISDAEIDSVQRYFHGSWIWGHPFTLRESHSPGQEFVRCTVRSPDGELYYPNFLPRHLNIYWTKDQVKEELLRLKEECGV